MHCLRVCIVQQLWGDVSIFRFLTITLVFHKAKLWSDSMTWIRPVGFIMRPNGWWRKKKAICRLWINSGIFPWNFFYRTKLWNWLANQLDTIGLEVYRQNFTFSHGVLHPSEKIEGTNLYGIMRSPSGGRTEALLLTVPLRTLFNSGSATKITAGGVALSLALLKTLRGKIFYVYLTNFVIINRTNILGKRYCGGFSGIRICWIVSLDWSIPWNPENRP